MIVINTFILYNKSLKFLAKASKPQPFSPCKNNVVYEFMCSLGTQIRKQHNNNIN